jgi:hypothetical protein
MFWLNLFFGAATELNLVNKPEQKRAQEGSRTQTDQIEKSFRQEHIIKASTALIEDSKLAQILLNQNNLMSGWRENQDTTSGLKFYAALELRTPLRVLLRDGEIHTDINSDPEKIANAQWEGYWAFHAKTFRDLGIDMDEPSEDVSASEIGYVDRRDYLPFLIALRRIVELEGTIASRIEKLCTMPKSIDSDAYIVRHGGINKIVEVYFPRFINGVPKISDTVKDVLSALELDTANKLSAAPHRVFLEIKGMEAVKLQAIKNYCASILKDRDSPRLDTVIR